MSAPSLPINKTQISFSRAWARLAQARPGWSPDVTDEERLARLARVALACFQVPLLANFIGPVALVWFALVLTNEFYINPAVAMRFMAPHAARDPARLHRNWTILIVWGSTLYGWGWVYAWLVAGPAVAFLTPLWLGSAAIHGLTYFSNRRAQFVACVAMAALTCLAVPLFVTHAGLPYWCVLVGVAQFLFTVFLSYRDRNFLVRLLIRSRAESRAATQSNIAKSQFLATMSHELRTPLNAVIGYAELLQEDLGTRGLDQGADDAARISRAARHLLEMINEILDLSKIEAGKLILAPSEVEIASVLNDVLETAAYLARDNKNELSWTFRRTSAGSRSTGRACASVCSTSSPMRASSPRTAASACARRSTQKISCASMSKTPAAAFQRTRPRNYSRRSCRSIPRPRAATQARALAW